MGPYPPSGVTPPMVLIHPAPGLPQGDRLDAGQNRRLWVALRAGKRCRSSFPDDLLNQEHLRHVLECVCLDAHPLGLARELGRAGTQGMGFGLHDLLELFGCAVEAAGAAPSNEASTLSVMQRTGDLRGNGHPTEEAGLDWYRAGS